MYSYLIGQVKDFFDNNEICLLTKSGIGFSILLRKDLYEHFKNNPDLGDVELYIETKVRENDITLYGFSTKEEKWWFSKLTGVQGVGGKVALSLINIGTEEINNAIYNKEISVLTIADGVGKRGAERIISEMKKFCKEPDTNLSLLLEKQKLKETVEKGLKNLGYNKSEFTYLLENKIQTDDTLPSSSQLIQEILSELGNN
jgi:Holliday junction DNA helicase RuvA